MLMGRSRCVNEHPSVAAVALTDRRALLLAGRHAFDALDRRSQLLVGLQQLGRTAMVAPLADALVPRELLELLVGPIGPVEGEIGDAQPAVGLEEVGVVRARRRFISGLGLR